MPAQCFSASLRAPSSSRLIASRSAQRRLPSARPLSRCGLVHVWGATRAARERPNCGQEACAPGQRCGAALHQLARASQGFRPPALPPARLPAPAPAAAGAAGALARLPRAAGRCSEPHQCDTFVARKTGRRVHPPPFSQICCTGGARELNWNTSCTLYLSIPSSLQPNPRRQVVRVAPYWTPTMPAS